VFTVKKPVAYWQRQSGDFCRT